MTTPLSLLGRKAQLLGLRDAIDVGGGKALFYAGLPPATPDEVTAEALLGTLALATPSGVVGNSGPLATLTLTTPRVAAASGSGAVGWVRLTNAAGDGFMDLLAGLAGLAGSGAPVIVNLTQVYAGGELQLISCVIAE